MNIAVVYPVPLDSPEMAAGFLPDIQRFCQGWRKFPPGVDCTVYAVCCNAWADQGLRDEFWGLPVTFCRYDGEGTDVGASQWLSGQLPADTFQISLTSRVIPSVRGWVLMMAQARRDCGPGLFGTSVSREGGALHVCTRCYALDAGVWNKYPILIDSRNKGTLREIGGHGDLGTFADWCNDKMGLPAWVVYRHSVEPWRFAENAPNIFRRGDQSNLIIQDRHSLLYQNATPEEKSRLEDLCRGTEAKTL